MNRTKHQGRWGGRALNLETGAGVPPAGRTDAEALDQVGVQKVALPLPLQEAYSQPVCSPSSCLP